MVRMFLGVVCLLALAMPTVFGAYCVGKPSPDAQPNTNPVVTAAPVFVNQTTYQGGTAKMYMGGADGNLPIVHLWGTAYEKGYVHGAINPYRMNAMIDQVWTYFEQEVEQAINSSYPGDFNVKFLEDVANFGLEVALDIEIDITKNFTGDYFWQELQGMADGSGVSFDKAARMHLIGELTKGSCSMYGVWGKATESTGGNLLQLRALDWASQGPFSKYPELTVYHNDAAQQQGNSFINAGWTGWIGALTGMSDQKMGISEIGVSYPDASFGKESRVGVPFTFLLRDILQWDNSLTEAKSHMTNAHRTCDLILGVGDGKPGGGFVGVEYSASVANFQTPTNQQPLFDWHPRIPDVVYYGMDWLCPAFNQKLGEQIQANYGKITPESTIRDITAIVETGSTHVAVYDFANSAFYFAHAGLPGQEPHRAFDRGFYRVDLAAAFALTP